MDKPDKTVRADRKRATRWVRKTMDRLGVNNKSAKPRKAPPTVTPEAAQTLLETNLPNKRRGLRAKP